MNIENVRKVRQHFQVGRSKLCLKKSNGNLSSRVRSGLLDGHLIGPSLRIRSPYFSFATAIAGVVNGEVPHFTAKLIVLYLAYLVK